MPHTSKSPTSSSSLSSYDAAPSFSSFLERWLVRQEHYLDELLSVEQHCLESREEDLRELISRILSHYEQYYQEKSRIAQQNIFLVLSPSWFSPLERSLLWISGFRPALTFPVVNNSVNDLSNDQNKRIVRIKEDTRVSERLLNDELARIQESIGSPPLIDAVRRQVGVGEDRVMVAGDRQPFVAERIGSAMEAVVAKADLLRTDTVMKVVEVLNPVQSVKFLIGVTQLQLNVRNMGFQRQ